MQRAPVHRMAEREERPAPTPELSATPRRAPEITDPTRAIKPAKLTSASARQGDLFDSYELPGLELLHDPPPNSHPKIDKLALERNARLLETVLDDFNVKGEITAVRTGPVVTMYELEPAPGIKASRVIGLADEPGVGEVDHRLQAAVHHQRQRERGDGGSDAAPEG